MRRGSLSSVRSHKAVLTQDEVITYITIPPDGGWGWMIVFTSFCFIYISDGAMTTYALFRNAIQENFECSESAIMIPSSVIIGVYYLAGPLGCALVNKFGFRIAAILGNIFAVCGYVGASFSNSLILFTLSYGIIVGSGFSLVYIAAVLSTGFYFDKWRALATSIVVCGSSVGTTTFPIIFSDVLKDLTWNRKYQIIAGACLFCGILSFMLKPLKPKRVVSKEEKSSNKPLTKVRSFESISQMSDDDQETANLMYPEFHNITYPTNAELHTREVILEEDDKASFARSKAVSVRSTRSIRTTRSLKPSPKPRQTMDQMSVVERYEEIIADSYQYNKFHRCMLKLKAKICCCFMTETIPQRPMYRDDILYSHSLSHLPQYEKTKDKNLKFHLKVTRVTTQDDVEEEFIPCVICPESVKRVLSTMFDLSLLAHKQFILVNVSAFVQLLGYYLPFFYFGELAKKNGVPERECLLILTVLGISNIIGRVGCGVISSLPNVNALLISIIAILISGTAVLIAPFFQNTIYIFTMVAIFGLLVSVSITLRAIVIVDLLGLENLSNAFGINMVFQGIACLVGIPIGGILSEAAGVDSTFYFGGGCIVFSGFLLVPIKCIKNPLLEAKKEGEHKPEHPPKKPEPPSKKPEPPSKKPEPPKMKK